MFRSCRIVGWTKVVSPAQGVPTASCSGSHGALLRREPPGSEQAPLLYCVKRLDAGCRRVCGAGYCASPRKSRLCDQRGFAAAVEQAFAEIW
jgi:hypothetical protein